MSFGIPSGAKYILQTLAGAGYEAYLVGGCVRDLLRGASPHDWDICTSARPEESKACFAGRRVLETGMRHGSITVPVDGRSYEITTYRAEGPYSDSRRPDYVRFVSSLEADLARRDFTMNAIAMGLDSGLQDPFNGRKDIENGVIRCVGQPDRRFREDGLRIMRALRFAAVLGFEIEAQTARAIHESRATLGRVAAERINAELRGLLAGQHVGDILRQYPDVLCQFWPPLTPPAAPGQDNPRPCRDEWEHTVQAVNAAPPCVELRLALLLHDIGKSACKPADKSEIGRLHGRPDAQLADQMLRALKFDHKTRDRVAALIECYDERLPPQGPAIRRLLSRLGAERFFQLLEVRRADILARACGHTDIRLMELDEIKRIAEEAVAQGQCLTLRDLAVNGRDVIAAGVAPGPAVGRVLKGLLEQVLNGDAPNEREALLELIARAQPPFENSSGSGKSAVWAR